ncbi:MAG: UbiA family prenyltransferase [Thermoplasmatota archaeon]
MATIRDWLQLFRSHTSPLEMIITTAGAALAVGTLWDIRVLLFLIFGWLYHNAGYGHNSAEDFIRGFDRDDPNKSHHPLQRGAISPALGRRITILMVAFSLLYGSVISGLDPAACIVLLILTAMGFVYNMYGKVIKGKFVPIALAHSLLLPFAYLGAGGSFELTGSFPFMDARLTAVAAVSTLYLIFQIAYQIMIEGDLKDIDMEEASFLKGLGVGIRDGGFTASPLARFMSFSLKMVSIAALLWIVWLLDGAPDNYISIGVLGMILLIFDHRLMRSRKWDHGECLRTMAIMEVTSTFSLLMAIVPRIGWIAVIVVMILNMGYFVVMNRYLWGTMIKPKV